MSIRVLIDSEGKALLYNGGVLLAPALPTGYTELEYIISHWTSSSAYSYIDTNIILNVNSRIETKFLIPTSTSTTNYAIFGASNGSTYNTGECALFWNYSGGRMFFEPVKPTSNSTSSVLQQINCYPDRIYKVSYDKEYIDINSTLYASNWYSEYQGNRSLYIGATHRSGSTGGWGSDLLQIYYTRVYNNGELIFNGIPAKKNSDNTIGMYDTITQSFFSSPSNVKFTAGPNLDLTSYSINFVKSSYVTNYTIDGTTYTSNTTLNLTEGSHTIGVTGTYTSLMARASGNNIIGNSTTLVNGVTSTGAYSGTLNITSSGLVSIASNSYDFGTAPMTITFEGSMNSGGGSN